MTARNITRTDQASSCYFRTTADGGTRKALVQIDERCNLHCAHCFVSATRAGQSMPYDGITGLLIPRLKACRVERVTLTGGEPTIHPRFTEIVRALRGAGMQVGFCTNATTLTDAQISELAGIGGVHANASLAEDEEYRELCEFAAGNGASYVLMNPLSSMGRGVKSRGKLSSGEEHMRRIRALTAPFDSPDLEIVHIRFPSTAGQPLAGCEAGTIIYVFTAGEVTVCPYLVFAARTPQSRHDPGEFIVGNIFTDPDIAARLDAYRFTERYEMGANPTCRSCGIAGQCGKGCPAAVIAAGERIGAVDAEVCPVTSGERRLLPVMPA